MITCLKCGNYIPDGQKFCSHCGSPAPIVCPYCGQLRDSSMPHCPNCGDGRAINGFTPATDLTPASDLTPPAPPTSIRLPKDREQKTVTPPEFVPDPVSEKKPKRRFPKVLLFGGIGAAVVALAVLCVVLFAGRASTSADYAIYLKDREIYYSGISGTSSQISERFLVSDDSNEYLSNVRHRIAYWCRLSSDGKLLFYPDRIDNDSNTLTLYYRSVNNPKKEPVKISADVYDYVINDDATLVTYRRYSDDALYQYNTKTGEKEKIGNSVSDYDVSADGKRIIYRDDEQNLYLKVSGKDKEKIDSDIKSCKYITPDFKTVYYYKEDSFYRKTEGESKTKLASNVYLVLGVYDTGEFYYLRNDSVEHPLSAYVEDDMYDIDLNITYPTSPDYPRRWRYNNETEYQNALAAYEAASAQYDIDYQLYLEKSERDDLRWDLENNSYTEDRYTLFYYDGANSVKISDNITSYTYNSSTPENTPALAITTTINAEFGKIKLSEISYVTDVNGYIYDQMHDNSSSWIAMRGTLTEIDVDITSAYIFAEDGKTFYFRDREDNLYSVKLGSGATPELYDTDLAYYDPKLVGDKLLYFKNASDPYVADLYCNGKLVDYDVLTWSLRYTDDGKTIAYCADWSENSQSGVLKVYQGSSSETVSDDCHEFTLLPSGSVLYLYDYSTRYYKGDLYIYRNGKTEKLDEEVIAILPLEDVKD